MRALPAIAVVCLISFAVPSSVAQQSTSTSSSPTTSDPQAVALIQKSLAALTSGATVTDATLTGIAQRIAGSDDESGSATLKATALGDSVVTLNLSSGVRTEIRNHSALPLPSSVPAGVTLPAQVTSTPAGGPCFRPLTLRVPNARCEAVKKPLGFRSCKKHLLP